MEKWKCVTHVDWAVGILEVSTHGRVKRLAHTYSAMGRWGFEHETSKPEFVLSPWVDNNGYLQVSVMVDSRRRKLLVHRLIAMAFVQGYEPGLTVNHIDGNKKNNAESNLEWVTRSRNTQLQWETGLVDLRGDNHPNRKLSSGKVRILRELLRLGARPCDLAILVDVSDSLIHLIQQGRRWNHLD